MPTYRTLGTEMDSPRGRIYLIKAVDDERLAMTPNFVGTCICASTVEPVRQRAPRTCNLAT